MSAFPKSFITSIAAAATIVLASAWALPGETG